MMWSPPDEDFDRDRSDRRLIGWVGLGIIVAGVALLTIKLLRDYWLWR